MIIDVDAHLIDQGGNQIMRRRFVVRALQGNRAVAEMARVSIDLVDRQTLTLQQQLWSESSRSPILRRVDDELELDNSVSTL
jgi:hypothetical protein